MSQFTLSTGHIQPIHTLAEQIDEFSRIAAYLNEVTNSPLAASFFESLRLALENEYTPLLEVLGGEDNDDREIYPLPHAEPYFLPMILQRVSLLCHRAAILAAAFGVTAEGDEHLAFDSYSRRLCKAGKTAQYLRETLMEELPPLTAELVGSMSVSA